MKEFFERSWLVAPLWLVLFLGVLLFQAFSQWAGSVFWSGVSYATAARHARHIRVHATLMILTAMIAAVALAACGNVSSNTTLPPSPRDRAAEISKVYGTILAAADSAIGTGKLDHDTVVKIDAASQATTAAVHTLNMAALDCERQPDGSVIDATDYALPPGEHCDPVGIVSLLKAAQSALDKESGVLAAFGIATPGGT